MNCGDGIRVVHPLFQEEGDGAIPISPLQLSINETSLSKAIELNSLWHSRLPIASKDNMQRVKHLVCFAADFSGIFYAAAIWTDPIARKLNGRGWLELRRFAIADDAPKNTATRMLMVMRLIICKKWPKTVRLISYQDAEVHTGTIYKAAGWKIGATSSVGAKGWNNRKRAKMQTTADKIRWEYDLSSP